MADSRASGVLGGIVALAIGAYFFAHLFVPALVTVAEANTTALDAGVAALTIVVSIVLILAAVLLFLGAAGIKIQ